MSQLESTNARPPGGGRTAPVQPCPHWRRDPASCSAKHRPMALSILALGRCVPAPLQQHISERTYIPEARARSDQSTVRFSETRRWGKLPPPTYRKVSHF